MGINGQFYNAVKVLPNCLRRCSLDAIPTFRQPRLLANANAPSPGGGFADSAWEHHVVRVLLFQTR